MQYGTAKKRWQFSESSVGNEMVGADIRDQFESHVRKGCQMFDVPSLRACENSANEWVNESDHVITRSDHGNRQLRISRTTVIVLIRW